jgi:TRAP-type mannitol/chloroaromatic compound transport system permease large subunit
LALSLFWFFWRTYLLRHRYRYRRLNAADVPWDIAVITVSQRLANGLDNFALLAIPFFIFAGTLMNSGGIAIRLINLAQVMVGRVPGSLGHVNVLANMMFGSISGSAVAAAAAVGGTLNPIQRQKGYDPAFPRR